MADIRIETLAGLPILYDRQVEGHYGVTGIRTHPFINPVFAQECEAAFSQIVQMIDASPLGPVESILTGGISRSGNGPSYHHKNRAFDLDGFVLPGDNWVADTFPSRPVLYLAIESILRLNFGTVLSYDYNAAHEDHFHFDNGTTPRFKRDAKSHVIYLQNALVFIYGIRVGRDGVWGPETRDASDIVRGELGIGGFSDKENWFAFCRATSQAAMALAT